MGFNNETFKIDNNQRALRMSNHNDLFVALKTELQSAMAKKKCHRCGCFQNSVKTFKQSNILNQGIGALLNEAEQCFEKVRYDCLGCEICWPATAQNIAGDLDSDLSEGHLCPTDTPEEQIGWPPFPGDYQVQSYQASVAVCTLNSDDLMKQLIAENIQGISIIGSLHTENLGIEHIIRNISTNPNIRFLLICGEDTQKAIGHLPGQSLVCLFQYGVDEKKRIINAQGKRPFLKNITKEQIDHFLQQVSVVENISVTDIDKIKESIGQLVAKQVGTFDQEIMEISPIEIEPVSEPKRLKLDPAGYFVVHPDRNKQLLILEHYTNKGVLTRIFSASTPAALVAKLIEESLLSRLDHAAYLGRELARAEMALLSGDEYVQDRAPGNLLPPEEKDSACGCSSTGDNLCH
ncbi:MAG: tetrahydromethanopterin S-methyltransferase subunit A [Methyloprofundus sp.]|nr:MAG: tetrahydromethanopterin S-methyltransferase subunit A [Methyloprofundus sp.]